MYRCLLEEVANMIFDFQVSDGLSGRTLAAKAFIFGEWESYSLKERTGTTSKFSELIMIAKGSRLVAKLSYSTSQ